MTKRKGRKTPTASHIIDYKRSKGLEAIKLYNQGSRKAMEWQKLLLKDIMAVDRSGLWTHISFGYTLPRRNGKNEVLAMRELWGLVHGEQILHTAHKTTTAHEAWVRLTRILAECGYTDIGRITKSQEYPPGSYRTTKQFGLETITFLDSGGYISFRTRTDSGGLGEGYDCLIIDEAQEYTKAQESALLYIVSASDNPQTILCGTAPTMVSKGTVFRDYRDAVMDGKGEDSGWAEWGVTEKPDDITDTDLWYEVNPSLGYRLQERTIRQELRGDDLDFTIQRLGYWFTYSVQSVIKKAEWEALQSDEVPDLTGPLTIGIKYGKGTDGVSLSLAVWTTDNRIFVESIDCRPQKMGNSWLVSFINSVRAHTARIVIDGAGGRGLIDELKDINITNAESVALGDFIAANKFFLDAVSDGVITHKGQPSLTQAVTNADKRSIGTQGGWGLRSLSDKIDITLADSALLAVYYCSKEAAVKKRKQRAYY